MDLTAVMLPTAWIVAGWLTAVPVVALALRGAPWARFGQSEPVHVWYGTIFCIVALWNVQATVGDGFRFHLLGIAAMTLLAGPALALVGGGIVVALQIVVRGGAWLSAGPAYVTMVALPVAVSASVLRASVRWLPPNFFIYVFVAAFFGAALSLGTAGVAGAAVLTWGGGRAAELVFGEYAPYLIYLAFGEATMTGMVLTLAVVYRPHWVATFDDARYLAGR
jgi:uncharacterized membrane protein